MISSSENPRCGAVRAPRASRSALRGCAGISGWRSGSGSRASPGRGRPASAGRSRWSGPALRGPPSGVIGASLKLPPKPGSGAPARSDLVLRFELADGDPVEVEPILEGRRLRQPADHRDQGETEDRERDQGFQQGEATARHLAGHCTAGAPAERLTRRAADCIFPSGLTDATSAAAFDQPPRPADHDHRHPHPPFRRDRRRQGQPLRAGHPAGGGHPLPHPAAARRERAGGLGDLHRPAPAAEHGEPPSQGAGRRRLAARPPRGHQPALPPGPHHRPGRRPVAAFPGPAGREPGKRAGPAAARRRARSPPGPLAGILLGRRFRLGPPARRACSAGGSTFSWPPA